MSVLTDAIWRNLDGGTLAQIAGKLGTSPQQTHTAVAAALPLLLGALGRNAAQPQGADALLGALERDHAKRDPQAVLGGLLGGQGLEEGMAILGHVFGARRERAAQGLGAASGLDPGSAAQLLAMLAPLVMQALGQRQRALGFERGALQGLLGDAAIGRTGNPAAGGLLEAVLDRDGDGDVDFADLMATGAGLLGQFTRR